MTYEDNLKRWSLFFPKGAKQIKLLSSDKRPLKIIEERSRPINLQTTIDGENYFYHDPKDPLREAIAVIEKVDLEMCDILYVYGIGLGYIFEALKEWLKNPRHTLVFIEDQLTIIDVFLHTERAKEILAHPRVWVYYLTSDTLLLKALLECLRCSAKRLLACPYINSYITADCKIYKLNFHSIEIFILVMPRNTIVLEQDFLLITFITFSPGRKPITVMGCSRNFLLSQRSSAVPALRLPKILIF